jgi:colicin import membrane protein
MATSVVKVDNKKLETKQAELKRMADSIIVRDGETCLAAKTAQRDIRLEIKMVHAVLDPFVAQAKDSYDKAKQEREKYLSPLETMDAALAQKVKDFERVERERAAAEERRINEERRKKAEEEAAAQRKRDEEAAAERRREEQRQIEEARKAGDLRKREADRMKKEADERERQAREQAQRDAEASKAAVQDVKVQAAIPTVAGVPSRVNWRYRVVNANLVPDEYWVLNEQKIGADVRRDKEKTNIPGIEAYPD